MFENYKAKKWTQKILIKNIKTTTPVDCEQCIHNLDKSALVALKKIPLLETVCSKYLSFLSEPQRDIINMSSKILITETQVPKIHLMVKSMCKKIGIEMPKIYLKLDREPNASVEGFDKCSLTITSGLLECFQDDELYAVLAHECGHIACKHMLYHTIAMNILGKGINGLEQVKNSFIDNTILGSVISTVESSLALAFFHWERCSELSADRVAVVCCESANPVIESMMRLAGGTTHIDSQIDRNSFIEQAKDYQQLTSENKINKMLEFYLTKNYSHPLLAVRAYEAQKFANSDEYKKIIGKQK